MTDPGATEFGGEAGMIQPAKYDGRITDADRFTTDEERAMIMATDPNSTDPPDPSRVGLPGSYQQ